MDKIDALGKKIDELTDITISTKERLDDLADMTVSTKERLDDLADVVMFIKDRMVTKDEHELLSKDVTALHSKVDGIVNRLDDELDKRKVLESRVTRLEAKAS